MTGKIKLIKDCIAILGVFAVLLSPAHQVAAQSGSIAVEIEWNKPVVKGSVSVNKGAIKELKIVRGKGRVKGSSFEVNTGEVARIRIKVEDAHLDFSEPSVISIKTSENPFSFFARDVSKEYPIYIPGYRVVVLPDMDIRSYEAVEKEILKRKLKTKIQHLEEEEEPSFESAAKFTRNMNAPTWLGASRDNRIFEVSESLPDAGNGVANFISPKVSSSPLRLKETKNNPAVYLYAVGRGEGVLNNKSRHLEEGVLPILNTILTDDDLVYYSTAFVVFEKSRLSEVKGTDYLVADSYSVGHIFSEEQQSEINRRKTNSENDKDETVVFFRCKMVNQGTVPRYAWFKTVRSGANWMDKTGFYFDEKTGFSVYDSSGSIFCISKLNGKPLPKEEIALLLQPGEEAIVEFYLPHSPISGDRAEALSKMSYDEKFKEAKNFWTAILQRAASVDVPERRINEMIKAGLLHLDLITYGKEPDGTLAPSIGIYSPIGTESAPIMQFYASVGKLEETRRSLDYFFDTQHKNGFIGNYGGYMVETGAVLWNAGEYFRYSRDLNWAKAKKEKMLKACRYLTEWRNKNKKEELKGKGYGMIDGKVADPEDHFRQFMLNGYAYLGMSRVAEILKDINAVESKRIGAEAEAWKKDIRESFFSAMGRSPVVPLGDGTWCPTVPPWADADGPEGLLFREKAMVWTHGTFTAADALLGPLYLVFTEVLDPREPASRNLLDYNSELFYQGNSAFSQPYYSRHNWLQARLGMVKPFLNTYYYTVSAHADRETYTFWEHMFKASPHKTHEEAWFLMQTRWMLYMENGDTLSLFRTIPRKWLEDGKTISLNGVRSYFGKLNVKAASHVNKGFIEATVSGEFSSKPRTVTVRLPHPGGKEPVKVTGGIYDKETETIIVNGFTGEAKIMVQYE